MDLVDIDAVLDELEEEEENREASRKTQNGSNYPDPTSSIAASRSASNINNCAEDNSGRRIPPDPAPPSIRLKANAQLLLSLANFSQSSPVDLVPPNPEPAPPPTPTIPSLAPSQQLNGSGAVHLEGTSNSESVISPKAAGVSLPAQFFSQGLYPDSVPNYQECQKGNNEKPTHEQPPIYTPQASHLAPQGFENESGTTSLTRLEIIQEKLHDETDSKPTVVDADEEIKCAEETSAISGVSPDDYPHTKVEPMTPTTPTLVSYPILPSFNVVNRYNNQTSVSEKVSIENEEKYSAESIKESPEKHPMTFPIASSDCEAPILPVDKPLDIIEANPGLRSEPENTREPDNCHVNPDSFTEEPPPNTVDNTEGNIVANSCATEHSDLPLPTSESTGTTESRLEQADSIKDSEPRFDSDTPSLVEEIGTSPTWKMEASPHPVGFKMIEPTENLQDISDSELDQYLGGLDTSTLQLDSSIPVPEYYPEEVESIQEMNSPEEIHVNTSDNSYELEVGSADTSTEFISPREALEIYDNHSNPEEQPSSIESSTEIVQMSMTPTPFNTAENFSTPPESPEKTAMSVEARAKAMNERGGENTQGSIHGFTRNSCDVAEPREDCSDDDFRIDDEDNGDGDYVTLSFNSGDSNAIPESGDSNTSERTEREILEIPIEESMDEAHSDAAPEIEIEEQIPAATSPSEAADFIPEEASDGIAVGEITEEESIGVPEAENGTAIAAEPQESTEEPQAPESVPAPSVVASTHLFPPMLENYSLTESELQLGKIKPNWIPDSEAPNCMLCEAKFTLVKRRHHCRACGRVLCNECCNTKASLAYLAGTKEAEQRVCEPCRNTLQRISEYEAEQTLLLIASMHEEGTTAAQSASSGPSNEGEGQSSSPSTQRAGLLKRQRTTSTKSVTFSDGVRPGSDSPDTPSSSGASAGPTTSSSSRPGPNQEVPAPSAPAQVGSAPAIGGASARPGSRSGRSGRQVSRRTSRAAISTQQEMESFLPKLTAPQGCPAEDGTIPPPGEQIEGWDWPFIVLEGMRHRGDPEQLMKQMTEQDSPPVEFAIKRNLTANIKLIKLSCCVGKEVWCIASQGLRCVAQDEIMILIERTPNERRPPFDVLRVYNALYEEALRGSRVSEMDHTVVAAISGLHFGPDGFLGSREHAGFLYIRPTFQCIRKLPVPDKPYLVGLLITRSEVPWVKVLPMRLFYRLGAEYRVYPCPMVSQRFRRSMFNDIGHTIMNLLADFRNYSYSLPLVQGCHIHLQEERTTLYIPKFKHYQIEQIIQTAQQQHVLAWATDFSQKADSHLVCIQEESGSNYHSQTVNIEGKTRKVTGSTFIVLNGALKAAGFQAKTSIVEDGVMAQIRPEIMETLVTKLKNKEDFTVLFEQPSIASTPDTEPNEEDSEEKPGTSTDTGSADKTPRLEIRWIDEVTCLNPGYSSPIDGKKLEGLPCLKVSGKIADHSGGSGPHLLRMTELFVLSTEIPRDRLEECQGDLLTMGRHITQAGSKALLPYADELARTGLRSLGIRVSLGPDMVEFLCGAGGNCLPQPLMAPLDTELVPILYTKASSQTHTITIEIILRVLDL